MRRMWNKSQLGGELTPDKLSEVLEGSETVVVDENEEGDKLQVRLDNDVITKIDKALVTPTSAPTENVLVGVGTGREQIQVKVGEGLALEGETSPYTLVSNLKILNLPEKFFTEGEDVPITDEEIALFDDNVIALKNIIDGSRYIVLSLIIKPSYIEIRVGCPYDTIQDTADFYWINIIKTTKIMNISRSIV